MISKIAPCLWFDDQAEEAANFYVSVFKDAKILATTHYTEAGQKQHGRPPGSVMVVVFELFGQTYTALNGGPLFKFNEAISLQIDCATQEELDYYWERLTAGGPEDSQQCGWLKDRFGVSWQVVPTILPKLMQSDDIAAVKRLTEAMMQMVKLDIAGLERAFAG